MKLKLFGSGYDATEGLGVHQLAGGVALPKLSIKSMVLAAGFLSSSESLLLRIAYIKLNFFSAPRSAARALA